MYVLRKHLQSTLSAVTMCLDLRPVFSERAHLAFLPEHAGCYNFLQLFTGL